MKKSKERKIIIIVITILLILDQITKIIANMQGWYSMSDNPNKNGYYILITIIIIGMIIRYISNDNTFIKMDTKITLSLAIAGAIGNLIDRIWNKEVINFIKIGQFININFAYIYILVAWIGMAIILTKNTMKILKSRKGM